MSSLKFLATGDTVGIISTARKISKKNLMPAIKVLNSWGLNVKLGKHIYSEYHQFSGTDIERTADLQEMIDDIEIKAVICARGGYGTVRLIDAVDFSNFVKNPKWIVGYSDVTVLHSHIHQLFGIKTLHATMPLDFLENDITTPALHSLKKALFGETLLYEFETSELNRQGTAEGVLVGGNLSILYSLRGTISDIDTDGKILFLEDLDEYLYHVDRMMVNLKRGGKLNKLKALLIGGMTDMHDNTVLFGKTAEEIIRESVEEYDYPVCFNVSAGHIGKNNQALILGAKAKVTVTEKKTTLKINILN